MKAREIIARALFKQHPKQVELVGASPIRSRCEDDADAILTALREAGYRVLEPAFAMTPKHYGLATEEEFRRTWAYGAQLGALEKADKIVALFRALEAQEQKK